MHKMSLYLHQIFRILTGDINLANQVKDAGCMSGKGMMCTSACWAMVLASTA